jgi:hypothetical protein
MYLLRGIEQKDGGQNLWDNRNMGRRALVMKEPIGGHPRSIRDRPYKATEMLP